MLLKICKLGSRRVMLSTGARHIGGLKRTINRLFLSAGVAVAMLATGCGRTGQAGSDMQSEADLPGRAVIYNSGSIYEIILSPRNDIKKISFNTQTDCIEALVLGHGDVYVDDDCLIPSDEQKRLGIRLAARGEKEFPCGMAFRKEPSGLLDSLNYFIDSLRATGELRAIYERWFFSDSPSRMQMPEMGPKPEGKPIRVGESVNMPPVAFPVEKQWRGLEPELMERFGRYVGRPVEFNFLPSSSSVAALQSGNIDVLGGGIFITEERQKTMHFSESHFSAHPGYYVKDNSVKAHVGFGESIKRAFHDNLIVENRWRYITEGLWETVKISVLAILLGSVLGGGLCWMRMSRRRWVGAVARVYVEIMRGIPMLVFLMIMFYVILSGTGLSATAVAVVAFALNFAAYVSEMFRTAIQSVGNGQTEAGLAIGFTRWETFAYIVAPQALRNVMPVYKGEAVSLVKNTSIVGYIAIQDLTRASDMIRNRTFDAFFPLLIVTIIYFILAWLLGKLLDLTVKNTPKR